MTNQIGGGFAWHGFFICKIKPILNLKSRDRIISPQATWFHQSWIIIIIMFLKLVPMFWHHHHHQQHQLSNHFTFQQTHTQQFYLNSSKLNPRSLLKQRHLYKAHGQVGLSNVVMDQIQWFGQVHHWLGCFLNFLLTLINSLQISVE